MLDKLEEVVRRFETVTEALGDPETITDRARYKELTKEHADLTPIVTTYREWRRVSKELHESKVVLEETKDPEMRELALAEIDELKEQEEILSQELQFLLLPKDPNDDKNIIVEIRAGTGGDEAALFAGDLFALYCRYAEKNNWKVEILSSSESSVGGFKEVIARIEGKGAYSRYKYERGVHRVQRVPKTETQGRIHTSTVTAAVLPEAEEVDIQIDEKDLRIDVYRSSGPGGQSVNTTDSAVRVTHLPTNTVVTCQDEKSQLKNKNKALAVLRARLLDLEVQKAEQERSSDRRSQIGTGERSERIRTYNFPQGRVSDHRIGLTLYSLEELMGGELNMLIEPLRTHFQTEALSGEHGSSSNNKS